MTTPPLALAAVAMLGLIARDRTIAPAQVVRLTNELTSDETRGIRLTYSWTATTLDGVARLAELGQPIGVTPQTVAALHGLLAITHPDAQEHRCPTTN